MTSTVDPVDEATASLAGLVVDEKKVCEEAFETLFKYFDELAEEVKKPLESSSPCDRELVRKHAERLEHMITKYALFITRTPEKETILPMTNELMNEVTAVACLLRVLMRTAGPCLCAELSKAANQLVVGVKGVVVEIKVWFLKKQKEKESGEETKHSETDTLPQYAKAGAAFAFCKDIKKLPLTNTEAVGRKIVKLMTLVKDAKSEMDELEEETKAEDGKEEAVVEKDEDDFDDDEPLTPEEFARAQPCKQLANLSLSLIKKSYAFLLKLKTTDADKEHVQWVESELRACTELSKGLDNLGGSLYPPQDPREIKKALAVMEDNLNDLLDKFVSNKEFAEVFPQTFPKPKGASSAPSISREGCVTWVEKVKDKVKGIVAKVKI